MEEISEISDYARERLDGAWKQIRRNLVPPLWREMRTYDRAKFRADLMAGATVAVVTIPQAIGFALVVGLPVQAVLATAIIGSFVCACFSSSHHLVFGPTNTISIILAGALLSLTDVPLSALQKVLVLGCMIGLIQLVAGLTRIGQLTQFISRTVIIAYTTAVGVLICTGQIGNLLGIERGDSVSLGETVRHLMIRVLMFDFNHATALLGLGSLGLLLFLRRARPNWPEGLIVLTLAAAANAVFPMKDLGVQLVLNLGEISGAMPLLSGFPFNAEGLALVPRVAPTAMAVALLGMLEAISIAKSLAIKSGQQIDSNQELIGMGLGNLAAAACGAMPGSASFLRSAANFQSGGVTQLATVIGSFGVLVIVMLIAPFLNYIPVATLAAYLVVIAARLFNLKQIAVARRSTRSDAAVFWVTLIAALFLQLDTAIYVGVSFSFVFFLNNVSTPSMAEYAFNGSGRLAAVDDTTPRNNPHVSIVHVDGDLFFGAADLFQERVCLMARDPQIRVVVLRMKNARNLDGSTVLTIEQLADHLRTSGRHLLISGIQGDVARVFKRSGLSARLGEENIFPAEENPTLATKKALLRAQQLIGSKLEVRLFYDSHRLPGAATA